MDELPFTVLMDGIAEVAASNNLRMRQDYFFIILTRQSTMPPNNMTLVTSNITQAEIGIILSFSSGTG